MNSSLRDKTQKNTRVFLKPKKYVTDYLAQKNTERVNFQPKKDTSDPRHVYFEYPPPPPPPEVKSTQKPHLMFISFHDW